jgi:hypothetical protein
MPEYDAFGREIGEDTLSGLGGTSSGSTWEQTESEPAFEDAEPVEREPAPEPEPARFEHVHAPAGDDEAQRKLLAAQLGDALSQAARTPRPKRSGAAKGCLIAFVVLIAFGGAIIAGVVSFVSSVDLDTGGESIISPPDFQPEEAPTGMEGESLARPANFAAALREISRAGGGVTNLRVAPDRIDATLKTPEGRLRHVQIKAGGELERIGPDSGPGFDSSETIPVSRLKPPALARLIRRGAKEVGVPVSEFQYAVPQQIGGLRWVVYFTRSRYVIGDARGRFEREYPVP